MTVVHTLVSGAASGDLLVLDEALSFWGGLDSVSGAITDQRHPQVGTVVSGTILVMPVGRGSSSASAVLAEAIRCGTAPAALILREPDEIVALGAIVADELYGIAVPVLVIDEPTYAKLVTGQSATITADPSILHLS